VPRDSLIGALDQTAQAFGGAPWGVHALVAAGAVAGLILWLAGRKILKPTVVLLFALAGGAGALLLVPKVSFAAAAPQVTWAVAGLAVGAVVGLALFRFAMAVALGAVLGLAAPLGAAVALELSPAPPDEQRLAAAWQAATPAWGGSEPPTIHAPATPDAPAQDHDPVWKAAAVVGEELDAQWQGLDTRDQAVLALSAIGGGLLGVLLGLVMPVWASGAVSALLGPAVWLPCGVWLADAFSVPGRAIFAGRTPVEWLVIWGVLAAIGLVVQWTGLLRRALPRRPAAD